MTARHNRWQEQATRLYEGAPGGPPRYRESIIAELAASLQATHEEGVRAGEAAARERCLRESLAIARGMAGTLGNHVTSLERELEEFLRSIGKVTT